MRNVLSRFALHDDKEVSLYYYTTNRRDVESRHYVSNDDDLHHFLALAGRKPIMFVWLRGGDPSISMSPQSVPSHLELQHLISLPDGDESISSSSSGHGDPQEIFRNAVRMRDGHKSVLTGTPLRPKTGKNVEAAHIFGVERSLTQKRLDAGVLNAYDCQNGMLLEISLRTDFDANLWCMDEFWNVHVSEVGKAKGLGHLEGRTVTLCVGEQNYPSSRILRARYDVNYSRSRCGLGRGTSIPRNAAVDGALQSLSKRALHARTRI